MILKPRKPTQTFRETVKQEAAIILGPEDDAPANSFRKVTVLVPESPRVYFDIDRNVQQGFYDESTNPDKPDIGPNRNYTMPPAPTGQCISFVLLPGQHILAMADDGYAIFMIIVEYFQGGTP